MTQTEPDTRTTMLDYAIEVLETEGEQGIRVRDVAAAAGVTYSAVDHHFRGREGLIESAMVESYRRSLAFGVAELTLMFDEATTADEFRLAVVAGVGAFFAPNRTPVRRRRTIVLGAAATRPHLAAALHAVTDEYLPELARMFANPMKRGWIAPQIDLRSFWAVYFGIINSRFLLEMVPGEVVPAAWDVYALRAILALGEF